MVVLVLTACPAGLRGHVTRWLLEITPGVFVGKLTQRVRDKLWLQVIADVKTGRAIMVFRARNEQGLDFKVHGTSWPIVDLDGLHLVSRPIDPDAQGGTALKRRSNAYQRRRQRS